MIDVGRVLEGAFGLIKSHFAAVAIWAAVYFSANIALLLTLQPVMDGAMLSATAEDLSQMFSTMLPAYVMNMFLGLIGVMLHAAAMRAILRPEAGGVGFLRVGMDELRILLLLLLFGVVGILLALGIALVLGLLGAGMAVTSDSPVATVLTGAVLVFAALGVFLFLLVRFSLAFPLTLHRRRLVIGEAWTLSHGHFWTLFGAGFVVMLIGSMLSMVIGIFAVGSYFADILAASGDAEAAALAAERQLAGVGAFGPAMLLQTLVSAVIGAIWIALSGGSAATAAKLLLDSEFDDAEAVFG